MLYAASPKVAPADCAVDRAARMSVVRWRVSAFEAERGFVSPQRLCSLGQLPFLVDAVRFNLRSQPTVRKVRW